MVFERKRSEVVVSYLSIYERIVENSTVSCTQHTGTIGDFGGGLLLLLPLNNPQRRKVFQFLGIQLCFWADFF